MRQYCVGLNTLIFMFCAISCVKVAVASSMKVPDRIVVSPKEIHLDSRRAYRQIVVTGYFKSEVYDLTPSAKFQPDNKSIIRIDGSRAVPVGNGNTTIKVIAGGKTLVIPAVISNIDKPDPIRFTFETIPILTKQGCATGSCHGSPHGKGGFSLSLFGYDPQIDRISLTRDGLSRRVNVMEPLDSLMMKKPLLEIPHVGGKRLRKTDTGYRIIRNWIDEGANIDIPSVECTAITITPGTSRLLRAPFMRQQLSVLASYSDGSKRDVTAISTYESSNQTVAAVDTDGLITGRSRGQTAISVRYLDKLQSVNITLVEDIPGFVWKKTHENNFIDKLVDDKLKQLQYLPSPTCSDQVFLRRLSLDLTGMLPGGETARTFLADRSSDKRERLIESLLKTEEYARFWALKKADLMRVSPAKLKQKEAEDFSRWIVDAMRTNMPYDQFARAILTASGNVEQSPGAGYFLAIPTTEERTELTAQVFLGSRLECAKCHNHPFENWTMRDYYSLGAVFARTTAANGTVRLASTGESLLPTTKEIMSPWGFPKKAALNSFHEDRRTLFADWLTKKGNPLFARVEVNRIWSELMGRGIVEPVDDFRSSNPASNKALLDALAAEFEKSGYDRKHMIELICRSQTYQRSTQTNRFNESEDSLFSHARIRELTAEQMKDAIGYTTRALSSIKTISERRMELVKQLDEEMQKHELTFNAWVMDKRKELESLPVWLGIWSSAGPLKPNSQLPSGSTSGWNKWTDILEGSFYELKNEPDQVYYFRRNIHSLSSSEISFNMKAGNLEVWLNGKPVQLAQKEDEYHVTLKLASGNNDLILKAAYKAANSAFHVGFDLPKTNKKQDEKSISPYLSYSLEILAGSDALSEDQKKLIHNYFIETDAAHNILQEKLDSLDNRMEYATQRPYPEATAFTVTFGQPLRETACTCERRKSPTLLQALELLNGETAYKMAQSGADTYMKLDDRNLVNTLYLSALSRYPSEKETKTAAAFLAKGPDKKNAVTDLIWTVMNTQEFLFQH